MLLAEVLLHAGDINESEAYYQSLIENEDLDGPTKLRVTFGLAYTSYLNVYLLIPLILA